MNIRASKFFVQNNTDEKIINLESRYAASVQLSLCKENMLIVDN